MDTLIAGTALAYNTTLVTHNTAEFQRIPELQLADWFS
jgi:tRNA(fMet)-specific endonuclease VapC